MVLTIITLQWCVLHAVVIVQLATRLKTHVHLVYLAMFYKILFAFKIVFLAISIIQIFVKVMYFLK